MTVGGEEAAAVPPEQWPDLFAVGGGESEVRDGAFLDERKSPFPVSWREMAKASFDLEEEHQPVGLSQIAVFAHEPGEVEFLGDDMDAQFLLGLPTGAGVRRLADFLVELSTGRTPEPLIGLLCALQKQDFVRLVEAIEQGGDLVGQRHGERMGGF